MKGRQVEGIGPGVEVLYDIGCRSILGHAPPDNFALPFKPLYLPTQEEKADITTKTVDSITKLVDAQIFGKAHALKEIRVMSLITGVGTSVTDEDISQAEQDDKDARAMPPSPEDLGIPGEMAKV